MSGTGIQLSLSRRGILSGGLTAGAALVCASGARSQSALATTGESMCLITPQTTQGPYWFDPNLERTDITEGRAGIPLTVALKVLDGATCAPLPGARVDIWHCDAQGVYSGYDGQGETGSTEGEAFLRGWQATDADGVARFTTIYPGWYRGRTTHIHVKVFLDEDGQTNVLTCQLFFPDALSEWIFENAPDYVRPGEARDTLNSTDHIAEGQGFSTFGAVSEQAAHYAMNVTLGVDRTARSTETVMGPGGPRGPGGRPPGPPPGGEGGRRGPPPGGMGGPGGEALTGDARISAMTPKKG